MNFFFGSRRQNYCPSFFFDDRSLGLFLHSLVTAFFLIFSSIPSQAAEKIADIEGVQADPIGSVPSPISQLTLRFPNKIVKTEGSENPFKVSCLPGAEGFQSWADNNTLWTFNFKAKNEYTEAQLKGGTKCNIQQVSDLKSVDGKIWKTGIINYSLTVAGPNVTAVYPADGFDGFIRETDPVLLILFDGPVDRASFFSDQKGFLSYLSANAPAEKMPLQPVPEDQAESIFTLFKHGRYLDMDYNDKNWILATVQQALIPGAQVILTVQGQNSALNPEVQNLEKFTTDFNVRGQFQAEIQCDHPSAKNANCLPHSPVSVKLNGYVKWADIKNSYIEYIPYKSGNSQLVRAYPKLSDDQESGFWNTFFDVLGDYFPYVAKFSDTIVNFIEFKVDIEPQTQAKVVLPKGLTDIDQRILSNAIAEFHVRVGDANEILQVPQALSFFEKNVPHLYLPVGVVNLNQKLSIRKTGSEAATWAPIQDVPTMIRLIRAYDVRGDYRSTPDYVSPLETLGVSSTVVQQQLTGQKNRPNFLQFPFSHAQEETRSGLYAIEISSPSYESSHSYGDSNQFFNPKYVLAQVTDLAVHIKKGQTQNLVWVTRLSEAQPVAGAEVAIYNCLGQAVKTLVTNASGIATFANQVWAEDCQAGDAYSEFASGTEFFAVAKVGTDQSLTHSTWISPNGNALSAPGVEWFYNDLQENQPYYHSIIAVNLVKPGQSVPVELIAKIPNASGFSDVAAEQLPTTARVVNADDSQIYYEFPLSWKNGVAHFIWKVPEDPAVKMGRYYTQISGPHMDLQTISAGDIEVAEFKVPLMSGIISFPNSNLIQPDSIPVSSVIRYSNGVGAKALSADLSFYFESTTIDKKELPEFSFGSGPIRLTFDSPANEVLPGSHRPATLSELTTDSNGAITKDLALEKVADGRTVAEVLKTMDRPQKLVARLRYQDQIGEYQTLSQSKDIFNSSQYVGTHLISGSRTSAQLRAAVIDVKKENVTQLQDLEFKIQKVEVKVIGEELFGGLIKNTVERELKPVLWNAHCRLENKIAACAVGNLKEGNYAFQVTSKKSHQAAHTFFKVDSEGRVYGKDDYYQFGDGESNKQLPLALNKKSYKNGERAVVSFPPPFKSCRALVSVERANVMKAFVVTNACEKGFVEVPVDANQAPNAFVSVYAITGRSSASTMRPGDLDLGRPTYRLGFANLQVNWSRFKSQVEVKTPKENYKPGEMVQVQVRIKPEEGILKKSTVTLVVLEEKILDLKKNDTYKVLEALMQSRSHQVSTITSLDHVETVVTAQSDLTTEDTRKGGDEGGDGSSKSEFKRKLFNALVSFQPDVLAENGVAQFSFKTNDSLTRFKIFAIAIDANEKFGTGETTYLTSKDTQSFSNIPTVAHTGDSFPVKVTVQNNGSASSKYKVEVKATSKNIQGSFTNKTLVKSTTVEKATSVAIDVGEFSIDENASSVQYEINIYDANGKIVDSMEPPVQQVLPTVPLQIHSSYLAQMQGPSFVDTLEKESHALPEKGKIQVSVSKSLVSSALDQVRLRFERDSFADFFLESRFYKALMNSSAKNHEELQKIFTTLLSLMDSNGFVKYHPSATRGSVWLTANIINALAQEPWALKLLPASLNEKLKTAVSQVLTKSIDPIYVGSAPMDWLRAQVIMGQAAFAFNDENLKSSAQALNTTITESLKKNPEAYGSSLNKWSNRDLVEYWLLQVLAAPKDAVSSAPYQQLTSPALLVFSGNMANLKGQPIFSSFYSDETIETAKLLYGYSRLHRPSELARNLAAGLANVSHKGWYSASTLHAVAQSLKAFGRTYEADAVQGTTQIQIPETQSSTVIDWEKAKSGALVTEWKSSKATLQVSHAGSGKPWLGVQTLTALPLTEPLSQGLLIEKEVHNISRQTGYKAGDVLEITLKINSATDVNHVALQDPIPAGSNILSEAYGDYSSGEKSASSYKFYFEMIPAGVSKVKYQLQLNNPGKFTLPPTRAEGIYLPSIFGETPNSPLEVE